MNNNFSIILTINGEYLNLRELLKKIQLQKKIKFSDFEIIIVDAFQNSENKIAFENLNIRYFNIPSISRTKGLNFGIKHSKYDVIVRLDVRTIFNENYLFELISLYNISKCSNVGFVQKQVADNSSNNFQKILSRVMNNQFINGFAKYRNKNYNGEVDTLYLGCFNKNDLIQAGMYDEKNPKISEDADLNYRLKKINKKIYLSSKNTVCYKARENLKSHLKKIIEYGISKAIFFKKYYSFSNIRQTIVVMYFAMILSLLFLSIFFNFALYILISLLLFYTLFYTVISYKLKTNTSSIFVIFFLIFSFHSIWYISFIYGLIFNKVEN